MSIIPDHSFEEDAGPGMYLYKEEDVLAKALTYSTLSDAVSVVVMWEYNRSLEAILKNDDRDTCFRHLISIVIKRWNLRTLAQG